MIIVNDISIVKKTRISPPPIIIAVILQYFSLSSYLYLFCIMIYLQRMVILLRKVLVLVVVLSDKDYKHKGVY